MSSPAEPAAEIRRTLESLRDVVSGGALTTVSEADTRAHFIDPLLAALGYRAFADIQREVYTVAKEFLDYVLVIDGQPRLAVEAKRLSHRLTEQDAAQVIQYCSVLGIEWAVLTNGRELRLYHQYAHGPLSDKLLFSLDLVGWSTDAEFAALFEQVWLLSKEAFAGQDGPMGWLRAQRIDAALRDALTNPASAEVEYLREKLTDIKIEATVAQVAGWFKARLREPAPIPGPDPQLVVDRPLSLESRREDGARLDTATQESYWMVPAAGRLARTFQ